MISHSIDIRAFESPHYHRPLILRRHQSIIISTHGALGREEPGACIAGRLALEPGIELPAAGLVYGAAHAPDEREQE